MDELEMELKLARLAKVLDGELEERHREIVESCALPKEFVEASPRSTRASLEVEYRVFHRRVSEDPYAVR